MNRDVAFELVASLVERFEALVETGDPRTLGLVSKKELQAIRLLLESGGFPENSASELTYPASVPLPPKLPVAQGAPLLRESHDASRLQGLPGDRSTKIIVDESAVDSSKGQNSTHVLCLDFGTAKSKAFCAERDAYDSARPRMFEVGLGERDGDPDSSFYTLSSSVWVSDEGLVYVGGEAVRRGRNAAARGSDRKRVDSLKQRMTLQIVEANLSHSIFDQFENPTTEEVSTEDAIVLYLGYLTDTALLELKESDLDCGRNIPRLFTLPALKHEQRKWIEPLLGKYFCASQVVADTFRGRWKDGIPIRDLKVVVRRAIEIAAECKHLLDGALGEQGGVCGILEPVAVGSGHVWVDSSAKDLLIVVDVGAGTTDFSIYLATQNEERRKAFPINPPGSVAIRTGGDFLDDALMALILAEATQGNDDRTKEQISRHLRLQSMRSLKETLLSKGNVKVNLVTDQEVEITKDQFLATEQVKRFEERINSEVKKLLESIHSSFSPLVQDRKLRAVFTGGGGQLSMVKNLTRVDWTIAGRSQRMEACPAVPKFIKDNFDEEFQREYGQLAVAIGGALPTLSEGRELEQYQGGAAVPRVQRGFV